MALSQFAESAAAVNRVVLQHCRSHLDAGHSISLAGKFNLVERWILYIIHIIDEICCSRKTRSIDSLIDLKIRKSSFSESTLSIITLLF